MPRIDVEEADEDVQEGLRKTSSVKAGEDLRAESEPVPTFCTDEVGFLGKGRDRGAHPSNALISEVKSIGIKVSAYGRDPEEEDGTDNRDPRSASTAA